MEDREWIGIRDVVEEGERVGRDGGQRMDRNKGCSGGGRVEGGEMEDRVWTGIRGIVEEGVN